MRARRRNNKESKNVQKELTNSGREPSAEMMRACDPRVIKNSILCVDREAENDAFIQSMTVNF